MIARAVPLETAVLTKLERSDIPAPRVIASIPDAAHADGRAPLDVEGMTGRMEEVLERALRRL